MGSEPINITAGNFGSLDPTYKLSILNQFRPDMLQVSSCFCWHKSIKIAKKRRSYNRKWSCTFLWLTVYLTDNTLPIDSCVEFCMPIDCYNIRICTCLMCLNFLHYMIVYFDYCNIVYCFLCTWTSNYSVAKDYGLYIRTKLRKTGTVADMRCQFQNSI